MAENGHGGVEDEENTINNNNNGGDKEEEELSVPRGGPIYVSNFVGPLTSVSLFKPSIVEQLQGLEDEVGLNSSLVPDEDISVDELKILTDEELVDMAIKEAFKDDNDAHAPDLSLVPHPPDEGRTGDPGTSSEIVCKKKSRKTKRTKGNKCALEDDKDVLNLSLIPQSSDEGRGDPGTSSDVVCKKKSGKRKRNELALEESYMEKVEHVKRIKAKQDEEKAAVKLHSFNPSSQTNDTDATSSKTIERMKPLRSASSALKVKSSFIQDTIPVHYPEVALSIEVYHYARRWIKHQEFLVLGQQTLTELRDKIYCLTDHVMQKAGQHDPSGYFLIEETFCNDLRDQSAIDYSEPIFDWINNYADNANKKWECIVAGELQKKQKAVVGNDSGSELPRFRALDMHQTRFSDLKFRLGAGYLYCHQGDCRHTIVIRDMRLVHPEDIQNRAAYPILLFQVKPVVRKCNVCRIFRATKVTVDDKWAQENPCYFCDDCYYLLHYKDGCLLYDDFSVHDYQHD